MTDTHDANDATPAVGEGLGEEAGRRGERPAKSADAFRTIGEVADDLELPQHVLRFWETKFTQVKPLKRGGGRRYYRPDDVALLRAIRSLLYEQGLTIRGVQKLLREQGVRAVVGEGGTPTAATIAGAGESGGGDPATAAQTPEEAMASLSASGDGRVPVAGDGALDPALRARLTTVRDRLRGLRDRVSAPSAGGANETVASPGRAS